MSTGKTLLALALSTFTGRCRMGGEQRHHYLLF
jgi:hypothetical protein